jgi:hypothetical protein
MHHEVKKNATLDRGRALDWLFTTTRNSVLAWFGKHPFFGNECEFYTLSEFFDGKRHRVFSIYLKRHSSELKILCESLRKGGPTTKHIFRITDVDQYDDTDSDSETPHTETHLTSHELITAANA